MPKPEPPEDLAWCIRCRKVIGDHKGWFGAQCFCDKPIDSALASKRAHSVGTGTRQD